MAELDYPLTAEDGPDDLPRTLRRERAAREREARERDAREREAREGEARSRHNSGGPASSSRSRSREDDFAGDAISAAHRDFDAPPEIIVGPQHDGLARAAFQSGEVTRLNIPFFHLMAFFLKATVAAIPALILLAAILWGMGEVVQRLFPELLKMQIFIHFPQ